MPIRPLSQKQFITTLGEGANALTVTFNKFTAPRDEYGTFEVSDPTAGITRTYTDYVKYANVTLTKHFENTGDQDDPLLAFYDQWLQNPVRGLLTVTIMAVSTNIQGTPLPGIKPLTLLDCEIVRFDRNSAGDRDGSGSATLEIELAVGNVQR
jgi:hypothetical protein